MVCVQIGLLCVLVRLQMDGTRKELDDVEFLKLPGRFINPICPVQYDVTIKPCDLFDI